jgi:hypothetical protein
MIQRIQTIWLFLSALCAAFTYKFPFYTGNKIPISVTGEQQKLVASSNFILLILTALLIIGTFIIIFLYKNRKQQLWLTILALVISIVNIIIYFTELKKFVSGTISLTAILAFIIPIFLLLATNGIWKDEKLVKSLDRLR